MAKALGGGAPRWGTFNGREMGQFSTGFDNEVVTPGFSVRGNPHSSGGARVRPPRPPSSGPRPPARSRGVAHSDSLRAFGGVGQSPLVDVRNHTNEPPANSRELAVGQAAVVSSQACDSRR